MNKVVIYVRVSTEEQNPKSQLNDCVSLIKEKVSAYEVFEEKQSAWKDDKEREKFNKIKDSIKKGRIKDLYVWDLDRIYRNRLRIVEFLKFCKIYKCNVHSFRQKYLEEIYKIPSPWNEIVSDMLINIMGWMAEEESNKKSERVKLATRKSHGKTYSYKGNKWGKPLLNKKVIKQVLELAKQQLSLRQISERVFYWDKQRNKHQISKSAVHKIIQENKLKKLV